MKSIQSLAYIINEEMIELFNEDWEDKLLINIRKNISFILETRYENNQALMAKALNIRPNTLHTYLNSETKPPITFIYKLCSKHNVSVDIFLNSELAADTEKTRKKEAARQFCSKCRGSYYTYFFVIDSNSLKEGLIQEGRIEIDEYGNADFEILNSNKSFTGSMTASDELMFFDLKSVREKVNLVIKNPGRNIKEKYIGGMGIISIASPEDNRIPASQKIILSRARIPIDKYFKTLTQFLEIVTFFKIRKSSLIELLTVNMDISSEKLKSLRGLLEDSRVSNEDKLTIDDNQMILLQRVLDKEEFCKFSDYVRHNKNGRDILQFNSIKVNLDEDKMIYRFIKNEFKPIL